MLFLDCWWRGVASVRGCALLVRCPRCGEVGRLYYSSSIGWHVKHGRRRTHYVRASECLEIPLHEPRLALIGYMGGDQLLLPYIAKMIPPHRCYVEVFGGGAPLLLNKPPSPHEVYNDLDGKLVNLFMVVKEKPD
ncbi:MAG: DNA adenine methylase [Candidatus Freyarchaeota archaeon]